MAEKTFKSLEEVQKEYLPDDSFLERLAKELSLPGAECTLKRNDKNLKTGMIKIPKIGFYSIDSKVEIVEEFYKSDGFSINEYHKGLKLPESNTKFVYVNKDKEGYSIKINDYDPSFFLVSIREFSLF